MTQSGDEPGSELSAEFSLFSEARLVSARGTEDGLILRLEGKAEWGELLCEVRRFIEPRKRFLVGSELSIEWLDRLPTAEQGEELNTILRDEFSISIASRKRRPPPKPPRTTRAIPLFEPVPAVAPENGPEGGPRSGRGERRTPSGEREGEKRSGSAVAKMLSDEISFDEDANAKVVFGTLRSGQRIETPFSLVIVGDVNPGADLTAGGDILVLGNLRGTAHASAYDDDGQDRVIVALQMQPMQLRIGSVISRGSDESGQGPEIARIENRRIIVEAFQSRVTAVRRIK